MDNQEALKTLCYSGVNPQDASEILNLPVEKVKLEFQVIENGIKHNKAEFLDTIAGMTMRIVKGNLYKLHKLSQDVDAMPIPIDDLAKLTNMFAAIDKVARLERGEATSITKHVGLSPDEAMKIIQADFNQVENVDE